jgi:lipocalin
VRATYARRADGRLDVVNRCSSADGETEARGVARVVDERTFAKLKVRFAPSWLSWLPMVWGDYWIVGLAPEYSWAVVGDPGREYLWILARAPRLDDESMAIARDTARDHGFDVDRLVPTPQTRAGPVMTPKSSRTGDRADVAPAPRDARRRRGAGALINRTQAGAESSGSSPLRLA